MASRISDARRNSSSLDPRPGGLDSSSIPGALLAVILVGGGCSSRSLIQVGGGVTLTCSVGDGSISDGSPGDADQACQQGCPTGESTGAEPKLITSGENAYWKESAWTELPDGEADLTVDESTTYQTWLGFGGTFNEVGWDVLSLLSPPERDCAMKLLFDPKTGAGFVFGRIPIGASDYALDRYTLDETPDDYAMASFSIERDRRFLFPYIQAALAIHPGIHLWASPWTPPSWMKDNNALDGGNMKSDPNILQAYALYLARFVEEYAKEGLAIEAIHPQNEPGYASGYPSCLWTADLFKTFVGTYLGPTFAARDITAEIYLGTLANAESGKDSTILSAVTDDATAMGYVRGFGLQWNMISSVPGLVSRNLDLPIVQTEHQCGNYPWKEGSFLSSQAPNNYDYAVESWGLIRDWIDAGVNAYSAWNMVLDTVGYNLDGTHWPQNALLTVDRTTKTLTATPAYYVFRHVSQYVVPGATRVATTGKTDALAFKNPDGGIVAIVHNTDGAARTTILGVPGANLQFEVPARGWATVRWP